jgi:hypothetical protein
MSNANEASRLYSANDNDALFQLAERRWPSLGEELPVGISEECRFAAIRATQMQRIDQYLWRARALTAAVLTGGTDTAAGLLLQHFFAATERTLEGTVDGHENGHEQARLILEEMKRLVPADTPAWQELFARLYHEKRGFSFLMEGTGGGFPLKGSERCLREAENEYSAALPLGAEDKRGTLKVCGGLALVRYLQHAYESNPLMDESKRESLAETQRVMSAATAAGYRDVAEWAATNVSVMHRGEFRGWIPYEVL